jgi:hypothetical protein
MTRTTDWESRIRRRVTLRDLHVLSSVVRWGSMAKAASHPAMSQSAVSESIAHLEDAIRVRLLDRTPAAPSSLSSAFSLAARIDSQTLAGHWRPATAGRAKQMFDVISVAGGPAGAVLAARLSANATVEAGSIRLAMDAAASGHRATNSLLVERRSQIASYE